MTGSDLFEASLLLLAGSRQSPSRRDPWAALDVRLGAEFDAEPAAVRLTDMLLGVPDVHCWTRRRVAGIRRRYETFVVDVDAASPSSALSRLRGEWTHNVGLLLGGGTTDELTLHTRAAAVWRAALLTAAPTVSPAGLRLRERNHGSVHLLLRAAQLLGVTCHARTARGFQVVHAEGRGVLTLLSTIRSSPVPAGTPLAPR